MAKIDIRKRYHPLYSAPIADFIVLDVPPLTYFSVDGTGDPNTAPEYAAAIQALYAAAYTLKFMSKQRLEMDYVVPPLEGLWWADDMADFAARRKDRWKWRMMIMVPDFIDQAMATDAIALAKQKKRFPALDGLQLTPLAEGRVVQTLHIGAYDAEGPILQALHDDFLPAHKLVPAGHHHEIYLSDPQRTAADKLKTILRQPVRTMP